MTAKDSSALMQTVVDVATHPACWAGVTARLDPPSADAAGVKRAVQTWPGFFIVDEGRGFIAFEPDPVEPYALRAHIACLPEARGRHAVTLARKAIANVWATSAARKIIALYPSGRRDVALLCSAAGLRRVAPGRHIIERGTPCHS